jgi:hypothetical protein
MEKDAKKEEDELLSQFQSKLKINGEEEIVVTHSLLGSYNWRNDKKMCTPGFAVLIPWSCY